MVADRYPLPRVNEILKDLAGRVYFTSLDLFSGYRQVQIHKNFQEMTNFVCKYGIFSFTVMPCGLANVPAIFQRKMSQLLGDLYFVKVYLDGIIIHSSDIREHFTHLDIVFQRLSQHGLRVKLKKCFFEQISTKVLGHTVNKDGVIADRDKVAVIRNTLPPRNRTQLRSFLVSPRISADSSVSSPVSRSPFMSRYLRR